MLKEPAEIRGIHLKAFEDRVKTTILFNEALKEIGNNNLDANAMKIVRTAKYDSGDIHMAMLVFETPDGKGRITATETERGLDIDLGIVDGSDYKIYINSNGALAYHSIIDNNTLEKGLAELETRTIPEEITPEIAMNLPCIHGNWCGPGCSGPAAPINAVDSCCKAHDNCYGSRGYFNCQCDLNLCRCLIPYKNAGNFGANVVFRAFIDKVMACGLLGRP